jgi:molybdopterin-synthase adenylyltransferase
MSDVLFLDDSDRYSRLRLIQWWDQDKLRAAKVMVVGAGAIGNEVLKNLALIGIGYIWVIDCDEIEDSNLTRSVLFRREDRGQSKAVAAAKALRQINPDVNVRPIHGNVMTDVGLGLFRDADVVIGCLDNREARLWVNRSCWKVGTPWIDGGIQEINGVAKVFVPPDGACYECGMTENDYRLINLRYSCPLLKREDLQAGKVPTAPTIASMIGGLQVQEALKLLHGLPVSAGEAMVWNGVANNFYKTAFQRREDCLSHETYPEPIEVGISASKHTAKDLHNAVREHFVGKDLDEPMNSLKEADAPLDRHSPDHLDIQLDRDLVTEIKCDRCATSRRIMRPQSAVGMSELECRKCGQAGRPELIHTVSSYSHFSNEMLCDLGIPAYDMVRVGDGRCDQVFLLAGDR